MNVDIRLDREDARYNPKDNLSAEVTLNGFEPVRMEHVQIQVIWQTSGKGTRDQEVVYTDRAAENENVSEGWSRNFSCTLPAVPETYGGKLVSINWAVRVSAKPENSDEYTGEVPFIVARR